MQKRSFVRSFYMQTIILTVSFLFLFLSENSVHAESLDIAVHEFCPYICNPEKENGKEGYIVEMLNAIYQPAGYTLHFHRVPYVRGIRLVEQGIYDGMPMLNSQSSKEIILSKKLCGILIQNFYVKKGEPWRYDGVKSLENIFIGSIAGYNYSPLNPEYEAYLREYSNTTPKKVYYLATKNPTLSNLEMILKGRVTTFNECSDVVDYIASKNGLTGKFDMAGSLGILKNYMGISPKRSDAQKIVYIFDREIKKLRNNGQLNHILSKYGLEDWEDNE